MRNVKIIRMKNEISAAQAMNAFREIMKKVLERFARGQQRRGGGSESGGMDSGGMGGDGGMDGGCLSVEICFALFTP